MHGMCSAGSVWGWAAAAIWRNAWTWRGGAAWQASETLRLRAAAYRGLRLPTLNELYYNPGGNSNLKPEKGWNEDAGYTISIRRVVICSRYCYRNSTV